MKNIILLFYLTFPFILNGQTWTQPLPEEYEISEKLVKPDFQQHHDQAHVIFEKNGKLYIYDQSGLLIDELEIEGAYDISNGKKICFKQINNNQYLFAFWLADYPVYYILNKDFAIKKTTIISDKIEEVDELISTIVVNNVLYFNSVHNLYALDLKNDHLSMIYEGKQDVISGFYIGNEINLFIGNKLYQVKEGELFLIKMFEEDITIMKRFGDNLYVAHGEKITVFTLAFEYVDTLNFTFNITALYSKNQKLYIGARRYLYIRELKKETEKRIGFDYPIRSINSLGNNFLCR